ncbi:sialate O-acetylesterase [Pelagicoccus mobilis]|uniref:Sialate O-acetylesterase n=1 Tax=Pelagicoccus mobilis TaxID=415221 RepID=A0A934RZS2_9BACT|nr:sialate O-acetylesterase [Pelagicoccus mobilis]MBK1879737.1 sialate O-acetylesterase [Pelagicoccus mobilis]
MFRNTLACFIVAFAFWAQLSAEVKLPSVFTDHMVLQRNVELPIWGSADPGEKVRVKFNGQSLRVKADENGKWQVELQPMEAGGPFELLVMGKNKLTVRDVLIGEVWVCSGQSNMEWPVAASDNAEVEIASANNSMIRFLTVPKNGTQVRQDDFEGAWEVCSPDSVREFSAVGYFFGRRLQQTLGVPIGLIDNAWGGSAAEAWMPRYAFESDPELAGILPDWDKRIAAFSDEVLEKQLQDYEVQRAKWIEDGRKGRSPRKPHDIRINQHRPANIFNGGVAPILGYGIKGVIWYQGETNAGRARQYHKTFPLMISTMRDEWGQGDFPFYWVQLADFKDETDSAVEENSWAEVREAQTATMKYIPNGGQAVIIDVGEGRDIHPRNKQVPAERLARWALANQYEIEMEYRSPEYSSMEIEGNKAVLSFDYVGERLYCFDVPSPKGFAIAGENGVFVHAEARLEGKDRIVVWSDKVDAPVAVRYGWANNPRVNVFSREGLPLTPFRTDSP